MIFRLLTVGTSCCCERIKLSTDQDKKEFLMALVSQHCKYCQALEVVIMAFFLVSGLFVVYLGLIPTIVLTFFFFTPLGGVSH